MSAGAAPTPRPDPDAMLAHLTALFDSAPDDHWVSIVGFPKVGPITVRWARADDLPNAVAIAHRLNAAGQNVYVGMSTVDTPTRRAIDKRKGRVASDEAGALGAAYVEIDLAGLHQSAKPLPPDEAAALAAVRATGLPDPTMVLHSGGGLHLYWCFAEPYRIDTPAERALLAGLVAGVQATIRRAFAAYDWHLDGTADLARVLRLAGTINYNGDEPRPARLLTTDGPRVTTADLEPFAAAVDARPPAEAMPIAEGARLTQTERAELALLFQPAYLVGQRRPLALYGAGWLAKAGVPEADARLIFQAVAVLAADDGDLNTIAAAVASTYADARAGKPTAGWSKLTDPAAPLVTPQTAAGLDALMRRCRPVVTITGLTPAAADRAQHHDMSAANSHDNGTEVRAAHAGACPSCERLRAAVGVMRAHARHRQRLYIRALRRLLSVEALAAHPYHQGRVGAVLAYAREVATAPEENRRPDGTTRARIWAIAKRARCSEDKASETVKHLEQAGIIACERQKRGQGAASRNETWTTLALAPERARDEDAVLAYIVARTPAARRVSDKGHTHGGGDPAGGARKPTCGRCGPDAEVSETVTRQWRCTCCNTLLESRTTEVARHPNPVPAPYPQDAGIDPLVNTYPQDAGIGDAPAEAEADPALTDAPLDFTLYLALPAHGARVRTPDGPGILVGKHAAAHQATVRLDACPHAPPFAYRLDEVTAEDIAQQLPIQRAVGDD